MQVFGGEFSVCGFGHSALQSFKCVCVELCIKLTQAPASLKGIVVCCGVL